MADNAKPSKNSKEVVFALYNDQTESKTGGYSWYFAFPEAYVAKGYQGNPVRSTRRSGSTTARDSSQNSATAATTGATPASSTIWARATTVPTAAG